MISLSHLLLAQLTEGEVNLPNDTGLNSGIVGNVTTVALGIAGGIALIVVGYGGFKYVMSQGNSQETAKARDTIIYGLLGLAFVLFATVIITFVINRL